MPPKMSGAEKTKLCMTAPAIEDAPAQESVRVRLVIPLAYERSCGFTTAATYDCRVGTSISTNDSRTRNSTIAIFTLGAKGTAIRTRLEGKCVNTIVFTKPMRRD